MKVSGKTEFEDLGTELINYTTTQTKLSSSTRENIMKKKTKVYKSRSLIL
jgi:hypothetical protein